MKTAIIFTAMVLALAFTGSANARATCAELDNMIADMDILADALEDSGNNPDDRLDSELRALVVDARNLAEDENDQRAIDAVNGMVDGWNNGNGDLYLRSSDRLAGRLEFFIDRDCQ